jgi:hypothetical protein
MGDAMESSFRLMAVIGACVLMGACATSHPSVAPTPPASAPGPATAPAPAAAAPAAAPSGDTTASALKVNRIHLEDKTLTNDEIKALFAQGYKPSFRNGEVYYCRREATLGTRFESMICRTAQQMKDFQQESKDLVNDKQKSSGCLSIDHGRSC